MPKSFARRSFDRWLDQRGDAFAFMPRITESCKDGFVLQLDGVNPMLWISIGGYGSCEVWVDYQGEHCWDILADLDIDPVRDRHRGWYCSLCIEPQFFRSRLEIWEQHCFEQLLEWVNQTLAHCRWLRLYRIPGRGSRWAKLSDDPQPEDPDCLLQSFPVRNSEPGG